MDTICRKYDKGDYDKVVGFLRELYLASEKSAFWLPQRMEYAEYFVSYLHKDRGVKLDWKETIFLWETKKGELVGLLGSESPNEEIFIHTKPAYRYLEAEMLEKAERDIVEKIIGKDTIKVWCASEDDVRIALLQEKGYKQGEDVEYLNWCDLQEELPEFPLPEGFVPHTMETEEGLDLQYKIDCMTAAFDSKTYPVAIYRLLQQGPSYKKKLDIYVTDSAGKIVSFCIIWYDQQLKMGYFEPVGTDALHRRIGLGRATLNVGLHMLKQQGATQAYVGSFGEDRMAFYKSSGFTKRREFHPWVKNLPKRTKT